MISPRACLLAFAFLCFPAPGAGAMSPLDVGIFAALGAYLAVRHRIHVRHLARRTRQ
jgi:hypothetical protein